MPHCPTFTPQPPPLLAAGHPKASTAPSPPPHTHTFCQLGTQLQLLILDGCSLCVPALLEELRLHPACVVAWFHNKEEAAKVGAWLGAHVWGVCDACLYLYLYLYLRQ